MTLLIQREIDSHLTVGGWTSLQFKCITQSGDGRQPSPDSYLLLQIRVSRPTKLDGSEILEHIGPRDPKLAIVCNIATWIR